MKNPLPLLLALITSLILQATTASGQTYRMVPDPAANHHDALVEFLDLRGYWPDEIAALLDPLEGRLDRDHGTHQAVFVATLEDIPGLRPLPEGVISFVHRRHNVFYLDVADERLLLGISRQVERENGRTVSNEYHFETFDLIGGVADEDAGMVFKDPAAVVFFGAHGKQFGLLSRIFLLGAALLIFLAVRVRRKRCLTGDPVVGDHRFAAARYSFCLAAVIWVLLLVTVYGFSHFSAHLQFLSIAAASSELSFTMIDRLVGQPNHMRLWGFLICLSVALSFVMALSLWAGIFRREILDHQEEAS